MTNPRDAKPDDGISNTDMGANLTESTTNAGVCQSADHEVLEKLADDGVNQDQVGSFIYRSVSLGSIQVIISHGRDEVKA